MIGGPTAMERDICAVRLLYATGLPVMDCAKTFTYIGGPGGKMSRPTTIVFGEEDARHDWV